MEQLIADNRRNFVVLCEKIDAMSEEEFEEHIKK